MELTTEYLVIVEKKASEAFFHLCDDVAEFNKLLQTDPDIVIKGGLVRYKQKFGFAYKIETGKVAGKEQRFFQVRLTFDGDETDIEEYTQLLRSIKGIIHRAGGQPETLWDDVSFYYSKKAYPFIHKIENLMRKLITYFMLTNVGKEWVTEASPTDVKEAIDRSKRKQYLDVLHQIDFKHLGDLLFKPYQTRNVSELYEMLDNAQQLEDLNLDELKSFTSQSNWERYFSSIVDCDDEYLDKRWKELYDLRCLVAHNAIVVKNDYDRIIQLVDEVEEYLQKAIDNLDKVRVPKEDREQVAESVASSISALYGEFIQLWKLFETTLIRTGADLGIDAKYLTAFTPPLQILHVLREKELIDDELLNEGMKLVHFRNRLVHDANVALTEQEIRSYILRLEEFIGMLRRSWKDEIVRALRALGGRATLPKIYDYIQSNTIRKLPDTWQATVRYTIQLNSSDTETYKGGEDLFCHLGRGYWGLRDFEQRAS
jgi:hypothetical protein